MTDAPVKNWASADAGPGRSIDDVRLVEWGDAESFRRERSAWLRSIRRSSDIRLANMVWLLGVVGDYMKPGKDGAWPSIDRLAAELGWSRSTVKRALALAIEWGWLVRERHNRGGNFYAMSFSESVQIANDEAHALRMQPFLSGRPVTGSNLSPYQPLAADGQSGNGLKPGPGDGSNLNHEWAQTWTGSGVRPEPQYHRTIPSKDIEEGYRTERLGETKQDESLREVDLNLDPILLAVLEELGDGDADLGRQRSRLLPDGSFALTFERVQKFGFARCRPQIQFLRNQAVARRASA
ncbi:MAG TPA: helix-turn-helix domain-containing protein [Bosea sp. (in: a-proteobacteria)]|jgi:hypothetical protein|uniref:helix-turn-helix domain-containing protein n=1 Tax=Bosea sp. (in: a-proteobacteria) TaxID=1871050 RepID=UPI002E10B659|nr:helix-turn-helix domain-containing protein [Bosea sp. (in: a-proteobacteria)]